MIKYYYVMVMKMKKLKKIGLFILLALLYLGLIELIIALYLVSIKKDAGIVNSISFMLIKEGILSIVIFILYRKYLIEKFKLFLKNFSSYFSIGFKHWFMGFILMITANMFINKIAPGLGENEGAVQNLISNYPIQTFFLTTFFAPFLEEMIFRKSLQDCFKNKTLFMIISGLIFGYIHVMASSNPLEYLLIIPYGGLGFFFAKSVWETDNIYSSIVMHMLHNGVLTILSMVI